MASSNKIIFGVTEPQLEESEFHWEIKKFNTIPIATKVKSPIFESRFHKWGLQMIRPYYRGEIRFKIFMCGIAPEDSVAKCELFIASRDGSTPVRFYDAHGASDSFVNCQVLGDLDAIFSKMDFTDDTLRLTCKLKFYDPASEKRLISRNLVEGPSDTLLKDLIRLFESKKNADVTINVGGNILKAHKALLSIRSTVFARMFEVEMKESFENEIKIDDFGFEDVKAMLEFIYTGQSGAVKKNPEILLQLAEKYNLPDLKSACGAEVLKGVTIENAIERLYLADRINVPNLKSFVEKFIIRNKKELVKTDAFKELAASGRFLELFANIIAQD